ncbi:MAG: hypothetical protein WA488_02925 [Mycobacterium sp.]|uniref:hypothetical protein n=1 Tax=Mycobacterium sp. TaxID=1785 RepID=UPI003BB774E5
MVFLTYDEFAILLDQVAGPWQHLVEFLAATGRGAAHGAVRADDEGRTPDEAEFPTSTFGRIVGYPW